MEGATARAGAAATALRGGRAQDPLAALFANGEVGDYWRFDIANSNANAVNDPVTQVVGVAKGRVLSAVNANAMPLKVDNGSESVLIDYAGSLGGGGNNALLHSFGQTIAQPGTIVFACNAVSVITHVLLGAVAAATRWGLNNTSGGNLFAYANVTGLDSLSDEPHGRHVFMVEFNGASSKFFIDGAQTNAGDLGAAGMASISVGGFGDGTTSGQTYAHSLLAINRLLTAGEKAYITTLMGATQGRTL